MKWRRSSGLLLVSFTAIAASLTAAPAKTPAYPAWSPPLYLSGGGAEPSIRIPRDGHAAAYISAPTGLGSNFWSIHEVANKDGTLTFAGSPPKQPDLGTGGGDSEISISDVPDPQTGCQVIAYSGLHNIDLLDNFTTAQSTDCGQTFSTPMLFATQNTLTDRQWQTFDGAKTNFLIYHKVDTSQIVVSRSEDGGRTYISLSPDGTRGIIDATTFPKVFKNNQIGNIVTDRSQPVEGMTYPISGDQVHALYATFVGPRDEVDNAMAHVDDNSTDRFNHADTIYVAKSVDGGLTWADSFVYTTDAAARRELNLLFPVVDVDSAGNVYVVWSDQYKIQYAVSKDHGATWSKAYQINPDNLGVTPDAGRANIFPWIAAGGPGKIDVVWYHGEGGDTSQYRNAGTAQTKWTVAFAELFNAAGPAGAAPAPRIVVRSNAVTPVIHVGSICNNGTLCLLPENPVKNQGGDRTLLDFFEVAIDSHGRANIAYATDAATPGSSTVAYTRQNSGFSALDGTPVKSLPLVPFTPLQGTSCPGPQIIDPVGDAPSSALVDPGMGNVDSLDIKSVLFSSPDADHLKVEMTLKNLTETPEIGNVSKLFRVFWNWNGKQWYVDATTNGPGLQSYAAGEVGASRRVGGSSPEGSFTPGENGTITWTVPKTMIGNPPSRAVLTRLYGDDHGAYTVAGGGVYLTASIDTAPDFGSGADYTFGDTCPTRVLGVHTTQPRVKGTRRSLPATGLEDQVMPAVMILAAGGALGLRMRRRGAGGGARN